MIGASWEVRVVCFHCFSLSPLRRSLLFVLRLLMARKTNKEAAMSFQIRCIRTCAQDFVRSFLALCLCLPFFVYPPEMRMPVTLPTNGSAAVLICQLCMMAAVISLCNCVLKTTVRPFIRYIKGFTLALFLQLPYVVISYYIMSLLSPICGVHATQVHALIMAILYIVPALLCIIATYHQHLQRALRWAGLEMYGEHIYPAKTKLYSMYQL